MLRLKLRVVIVFLSVRNVLRRIEKIEKVHRVKLFAFQGICVFLSAEAKKRNSVENGLNFEFRAGWNKSIIDISASWSTDVRWISLKTHWEFLFCFLTRENRRREHRTENNWSIDWILIFLSTGYVENWNRFFLSVQLKSSSRFVRRKFLLAANDSIHPDEENKRFYLITVKRTLQYDRPTFCLSNETFSLILIVNGYYRKSWSPQIMKGWLCSVLFQWSVGSFTEPKWFLIIWLREERLINFVIFSSSRLCA